MPEQSPPPVDISFVLTVYNKAAYLPATLASLKQQEGELRVEYVLVDDCSTDNSLQLIEQCTKGWDRVIIVRNKQNLGPSIRVNQGARVASGKYVLLMDSDDILVANAAYSMWSLLEKFQAGVVYGKWQKTNKSSKELLGIRMQTPPPYTISYTPLEYVLQGKFTRMTLMTRRDLFLEANGCDERIFIQDESLPLRLAYRAKAFVSINDAVVLVPKGMHTLSSNKPQQYHDRFLAYKNALEEFTALSPKIRHLLYQHCVAAAWKQMRNMIRYPFLSKEFWYYLAVQWLSLPIHEAKMTEFSQMFRQLPNIRRME